MQLHTTPAVREDGDFRVSLNESRPGAPFAVINLDEYGTTFLFVESVGDADRLIRAAAAAKDKLIQATGAQVRVAAEDDGSGS